MCSPLGLSTGRDARQALFFFTLFLAYRAQPCLRLRLALARIHAKSPARLWARIAKQCTPKNDARFVEHSLHQREAALGGAPTPWPAPRHVLCLARTSPANPWPPRTRPAR